jgi:hypothetical protein
MIPTEFEYCNSVITTNDAQYHVIVNWLETHQSGWSLDWNTPIAGNIYSSTAFLVSVFQSGVSVSYKVDEDYQRFIKSIEHELELECSNDS